MSQQPSETPSPPTTPRAAFSDQIVRILWDGLWIFIGILIGVSAFYVIANVLISLVGSFTEHDYSYETPGVIAKAVAVLIGVGIGSYLGYKFSRVLFHPASPFVSVESLTLAEQSVRDQYTAPLILRRVTWGVVGFFIGSLPGGLVGSLFASLFFTVLGAAANVELTAYPEWLKVRFFMVVASMAIGGLLGMVVAVPVAQAVEFTGGAGLRSRPSEGNPQAPGSDASLTKNLSDSFRYIGLLFSNTVSLLLPSPVISTQKQDNSYIKKMTATFQDVLKEQQPDDHRLNKAQMEVITQNWIPQIEWTGNRANRERDANEMISWWQIILAAFIPFVASFETVAGIRSTVIMAMLGIFVTILTGLLRFRRPEERWKHYRRLTENYQSELWNYITLTGPYSGFESHKDAFINFNDKMTLLRENDVRVFLGEVASNTTPAEDTRKANEAAVFAQQNASNTSSPANTSTTSQP